VLAPHLLSVGSWQTPLVPDLTHRSPLEQSRDSRHAWWHRAKAHMSGELQSVLIEQAWSSAAALELLQLEIPAANANATATKPAAKASLLQKLGDKETSRK
jgi:hypothetical protein